MSGVNVYVDRLVLVHRSVLQPSLVLIVYIQLQVAYHLRCKSVRLKDLYLIVYTVRVTDES